MGVDTADHRDAQWPTPGGAEGGQAVNAAHRPPKDLQGIRGHGDFQHVSVRGPYGPPSGPQRSSGLDVRQVGDLCAAIGRLAGHAESTSKRGARDLPREGPRSRRPQRGIEGRESRRGGRHGGGDDALIRGSSQDGGLDGGGGDPVGE